MAVAMEEWGILKTTRLEFLCRPQMRVAHTTTKAANCKLCMRKLRKHELEA
jgi:hypothetical protein